MLLSLLAPLRPCKIDFCPLRSENEERFSLSWVSPESLRRARRCAGDQVKEGGEDPWPSAEGEDC